MTGVSMPTAVTQSCSSLGALPCSPQIGFNSSVSLTTASDSRAPMAKLKIFLLFSLAKWQTV